jgi:aminopeptidase N
MRLGVTALAALAAAFAMAAGAPAAVFTPGAAGSGDPFFPNAGNGGYDVSSYDLTLDWQPTGNQLTGNAIIEAKATQNLSRFDLDLRGFTISRLLVDGAAATFVRAGEHELVITPSTGILSGRNFTVTIDYSGTPSVVTDPDNSIEGWVPTDDGAFVVNEPQGSPAWYPVNDSPHDKATYRFRVTVPEGLTVVACSSSTGRSTTAA